jgi:hypothetical protein
MKSMPGQDKVSILLTFVIGLVAGGYVYLTGFATTFVPPEATTEDTYGGLVINGESYGECAASNSCLSFQLLGNGTYRAIYTNPGANDKLSKEGGISRSLRKELTEVMSSEALLSQSYPLQLTECKYGQNGTNYKFKVTLDGVNYNLDTCKTRLDYNGQIWLTLVKAWNYFAMLSV